MIKVACPSCSNPYDLDERRLPASGLRMRCPRCTAGFVVFPDGSVDFGADPPKVAVPRPGRPKATASPEITDMPAPLPRSSPGPAETALPPRPSRTPLGAFGAGGDVDLPAPRRERADPTNPYSNLPGKVKPPAAGPFGTRVPFPTETTSKDAVSPFGTGPKTSEHQVPVGFDEGLDLDSELDAGFELELATHRARPRVERDDDASAAFDLDASLPAPVRARGAPGGQANLRRAPAGPTQPNIARGDPGQIDLPGPVRSRKPPAAVGSEPLDELSDLPRPRARSTHSAGRDWRGNELDLPGVISPREPEGGRRELSDFPAPVARAKAPAHAGELDLPGVTGPRRDEIDLPRPSDRFDAPTGDRFDAPTGNRFDAPTGNRFDAPTGNRFDAPTGNRFDAPTRKGRAPASAQPPLPDLELDLPPPQRRSPISELEFGVPGIDALELELPEPNPFGERFSDRPPQAEVSARPALADPAKTPFDDFGSHSGEGDTDLSAEFDLPPPRSTSSDPFGDLELPMPLTSLPAPVQSELPAPLSELPAAQNLPSPVSHRARPWASSAAEFGDLELPLPSNAHPPADELALPIPPTPSDAPAPRRGHGELELPADSSADDMEFADIPQAPHADALDLGPRDSLTSSPGDKPAPKAPEKKRKRRAMAPFLAIAAIVAVTGAGGALALTPYGPFGIYAIEKLLPGAGDPEEVAAVIERADTLTLHDTREDAWQALAALAQLRTHSGLNRELLARSLVHESWFQIRFGETADGASRAAAIRERLEERNRDAADIALALAADDLRTRALANARAKLEIARALAPSDPYVELIAGELAFEEGNPGQAAVHFQAALEHHGGAAAQWGLARALATGEDESAYEAAIDATLTSNPLHAGARIAKARLALTRGEDEHAMHLALEAVGAEAASGGVVSASDRERADAWVLLGAIHELRDRSQLAVEAYDAAIELDQRIEALLGSGRALLLDRPRDALARFEAVLAMEQADATRLENGRSAATEAKLGVARAQMLLDRLPEADAMLREVVQAAPDDADANLWLGRAEEQLGRDDDAELRYRKAIDLSPQNLEAYLALAGLLESLDRGPEASRLLETARSTVPESARSLAALGRFSLEHQRIDAAIGQLRRALEMDPELPAATFNLAIAQRLAGQMDASAASFERLNELAPSYPGAALEQGRLYESRGESTRAVAFYESALRENPEQAELKLRLGAALVSAHEVARALPILREAALALPNSAEAEYYLGRAVLAEGSHSVAAAHFEQAIALDPTRGEYYAYSARTALEQGQLARALDRVQTALQRDATLGDAYWIRGTIRMRQGVVRDALLDLQRAVQLNPERAEAYAAMGECYDQLRQLPRAIAAYEQAVSKDDASGHWWYRLGRLRLDSGERAGAIRALIQATSLGDADEHQPTWLADAHRLLGDAMRGSGNRGGAMTHYRRYLELAPSSALDRQEVRDHMVELGAP